MAQEGETCTGAKFQQLLICTWITLTYALNKKKTKTQAWTGTAASKKNSSFFAKDSDGTLTQSQPTPLIVADSMINVVVCQCAYAQ